MSLKFEMLTDGVMVTGTSSIQEARAYLGGGFPRCLLSTAVGRFSEVPESWSDSIRVSVRSGDGFPGSFRAVLFRLSPEQLATWLEAA